ncbi:condensation domain-containing protein [Dactylosporangium sp. NPDC000244]|uniref:condensation domain-containing protein n=1 Tax=Dactylosporangium sp. NPDC000244 TaxID=3154365 RepID=UPI00332F7114
MAGTGTDIRSLSHDEVTGRIREAWADLLGREDIGPDDDFFSLGGQSLAAVRAVGLLADRLGVALPLQSVYEAPTPRALAERVCDPAYATLCGPVQAADGTAAAPLSWQQEWQYRIEQLVAGSNIYVSFVRFDLLGRLDAGAFAGALLGLVRRHDLLRTVYEDGPRGITQHVRPHAGVELAEHDLTDLADAPAAERLQALARTFSRRGYDLAADLGLRVMLAHLPGGRANVIIAVHHINFDGWSRDVLLDDFAALYRAALTAGPDPAGDAPPAASRISYADFARWQRGRFGATEVAGHLGFWRDAVRGGTPRPPAPQRPDGAAGSPAEPTFMSRRQGVAIGRDDSGRFAALAGAAATTPFISCVAAFGVVLADWLGCERLPVATITANRTWAATNDVVGMFCTVVPVVVDVSGEPTFHEVLARCRTAGITAMAHQEYPFEHVCLAMGGEVMRELSEGMRYGIALHPAVGADRPLGDELVLVQRRPELLGQDEGEVNPSTFDLTLELRESADGLSGHLAYQTDTVDAAAARALADRFAEVVRRVGEDPHVPVARLLRG